jgi:DNA-nicking Smr family endonuclease
MARTPRGGRTGPPPAATDDKDEGRLFDQEMSDVRPLQRRTGRALLPAPAPPPVPASPAARGPGAPMVGPPAGHAEPLQEVERWGERYALIAPGLDRAILRALKTGDPPPSARLDLHGLDIPAARAALRASVERAHEAGRRCLLVIHGRGHHSGPQGPVMRDLLLEALATAPLARRVMAVATAPPALGGPGAALVLLRRAR